MSATGVSDFGRACLIARRRLAELGVRMVHYFTNCQPLGQPPGSVKGGMLHGDFGFKAVKKPVHVHDLHATAVYLKDLDHTRLAYRSSGRNLRLADAAGTVATETLA